MKLNALQAGFNLDHIVLESPNPDDLAEFYKEIISTRWLTDNKSTLAELSEKYGISQERVRQIESESIKALKKYIKV